MKYLPFLQGKYSVAPGLQSIKHKSNALDKFIFQIDDSYEYFLQNKSACRQENIQKYYCEHAYNKNTAVTVNHYLANQLVKEYPSIFRLQFAEKYYLLTNYRTGEQIRWNIDWIDVEGETYTSLFDALCSQVQEDIAVCQLEENNDWLAAIHLCAPNYWSPAAKIGKRFDNVHAIVPGMEKVLIHYPKMLETIIQKGPYTRFAWGITTDDRLNHHPQAAPNTNVLQWKGRNYNAKTNNFFVRVERQNMIGFADANAFLFTIRTYFYKISDLTEEERAALAAAVNNMSYDAMRYKGLLNKELLLSQLY